MCNTMYRCAARCVQHGDVKYVCYTYAVWCSTMQCGVIVVSPKILVLFNS